MGALFVLADHKETDTVWTATVLLRVDLRLCSKSQWLVDSLIDMITLSHTVCDGGDESVHGSGAVEEHTGGHSLLPHEVAITYALRDRSYGHN